MAFSLALSGLMLTNGSYDGKVKLWAIADEASAECVATLEHGQLVFVRSGRGSRLASKGIRSTKMIVWRPK